MNSVRVYALVVSDTLDKRELSVNSEEYPTPEDLIRTFKKKNVRVLIRGWPIQNKQSIELINAIINNNMDTVYDILSGYILKFYLDTHIYIYYQGAKNNLANYAKFSKSGQRVYTAPGDKFGFIKPETFIKRYKLAGKPKHLPFTNYDTNDTGEKNCVYEYVKKTYGNEKSSKGIGQKKLDKYFNKDVVVVEDIINFCDDYKIKLQLWNLEKLVLTNKWEDDKTHKNKNRKDFIAIICNNHLYPRLKNEKDSRSSNRPELNDIIAEDFDIKKNVLFIKNDNVIISEEGKIEVNEEKIIENAFFKNITPNFTYKSEKEYSMRSLMYIDKKIEDKNIEYEEYDINKAYYTLATDIIHPDDECPVFTASSIWLIYNKKDEIKDYNYYLLSKNALKACKEYGFINNLVMGHIVNLLISKGIIEKLNIKYVKNATYTIEWKVIQKRINDVKEKCNIKDEFIFYNGILGKVMQCNSFQYTGLQKDDINLLNYNRETKEYDDKWTEDEQITGNNEFVAMRCTNSFKYINTINIYNYVISRCNLFLLEVLFDTMEKNDDLEIIKVKVDALVFNRPVKLSKKYSKYFKTIKHDEIYKKYHEINQQYINGKTIRDDIKEELECFKNNISYSGAPGTGKTTKVRDNLKYDIATTTTNLCLLNLMRDDDKLYKTTYSLFNLYDPATIHDKFRKMYNKTIWIDEFSMIPAYVWGFVYVLSSMYNCKFILSGDMNQIGPIGENKIDINTIFYKYLFANMELLETDYRNDEQIINLRNYVLDSNTYEIQNKFKSLYDKDKMGFLKYKRHISYRHQTKDIINYLIIKHNNIKYKWTNTPYKTKEGKICYSSVLDVDNGVILICSKSSKNNGFYKNDIWEVVEKMDDEYYDGYKLKNLLRDKIINVPMKYMVGFTLGYCTTAHSSQGLTIDDNMCIHDIEAMTNSDMAILYTAITRSRNYNKLHFYKGSFNHSDYGFNSHSYSMAITVPKDKLICVDDDEFNKYETMKCLKN
jgi:hypothetical protein